MLSPSPARRRRLWPVFIMPAVVLVLAIGWSAFWFYAASQVDVQFDGWRTREAKSGRTYECSNRSVAGYPFRLEVRCADPVISLTAQTAQQIATRTPLTAKLKEILAIAQIYNPRLVIAEFTGPATVATTGQAPFATAKWSLGRASVAGLPDIPQRVSLEFNDPAIDRLDGGNPTQLLRAKHLEWHGRLLDGSTPDNPVIETVLELTGASLQGIHPVLADPFDANIRAQLRGLKDFSPKPWPERFREVQAAGGRIDFTESRLQQGDTLAVAAGSLGLTADGYLEGELQMTVAGMERLIPALGLEKAMEQGVSQSSVDRVAPGVSAQDVNKVIGALDRMIPGLGNIARKNANAGLAAGINLLGQQTTLEGRKAQAFKVTFTHGALLLGPFRVAQTPPLF
jgi:hypothetical protein